MKKSLLALSATMLIVVLFLATSCLPTAVNIAVTEDGNVVVTEDDLERATEKYSGKLTGKITVNSGDPFTVTLYAHVGAGMSWSYEVDTLGVLRTDGVREFIYDTPPSPDIIGSGPGKEVWTFKALDEGTATITMTYSSFANPPDAPQYVNILELVVVVD